MQISLTDAQSNLRAVGANALAQALVLGIDECAQEGNPLTQVQQIALAKMAIASYDTVMEGCDLLEVDITKILQM